MSTDNLKIVGAKVPNIDAVSKVQGSALYITDFEMPRMLIGKILRSALPHARILDIDASKAEKVQGLKAILTARDFAPVKYGINIKDETVLATDRVRYVGDEVAAVAAVDEDAAQEALGLIKVKYEELPALFDPEEAMAPGAPLIHEAPLNIALQLHIDRGDVDAAFRSADAIVEERFVAYSAHQGYMEPLSAAACWDASGRLTMWTTSMWPSGLRGLLAKVIGVPESKVRIIQMHAGGAFGGKITMRPSHPICALLARKSKRPVKIVHTREEDLIAGRPRLPVIIEVKVGALSDGRLLARQVKLLADTGAYCNLGPATMSLMSYRSDALYRIANIRTDARLVYTNKTPPGAYRGLGNPQMSFALESVMDMIGERLGIDPVELRLRNATRRGDVTQHGWKIGSCGLDRCIERVAALVRPDWEKSSKGASRGVGMACMVHESDARQGRFGGSNAFVKILEDGKAEVISGEADYGQGARTIFAQIAAEELGLSPDDIYVAPVDTDHTPYALGPWGSRITISGGNAVRLAAIDAKRQLLDIASGLLEASADDLELKNGKVSIKGSPSRSLSIAEVARGALHGRGSSSIVGKGADERETDVADPLKLGNPCSAVSFAAQAAQVEVDRSTGKVKVLKLVTANDIGKAINPLAMEGQIEGGAHQGLGYALYEKFVWENGRIMNPSLLGYRPPTALDSVAVDVYLVESCEPSGPYGAKGGGELGLSPAASAIANAVYNAIGLRIKELPISPEKILEFLEKSKSSYLPSVNKMEEENGLSP